MGMKKNKIVVPSLTQEEMHLLRQLRQHPEISQRVRSILEIASTEEGPLKTADEVEDLLVEEMRRLGNVTMKQWAEQAEERVSTELKRQDSTVLSRKKNAEVVVCLWAGGSQGEDLVQFHPELPAPSA
jgi:ABC-type hemin transport system substrate-binding protein